MEKTIVIIDGNSLINRAYYAMQRPMITKDGIYTQGIYGFINMLTKIKTDYEPGYMAVAFDLKAPTFRHLEYKEYKAGRKKMPPELAMQMPLMKDVLRAMNITILEEEGFEADDIIGTVAREAEEAGLEPLIITGDKDELQLATDKTRVLITRKGISQFDLFDRDKMIETYGFTPQQFIDYKGLMGDQSDNIPGIPGVGEKTAQKLILEFGSMDNIIANTDKISAKKLREKIEENVQLAVMSKRLATINVYVPLEINFEDFKLVDPDYNKLIEIYTKLEFNSFLKKMDAVSVKEAASDKMIDTAEMEVKIIASKDEALSIDLKSPLTVKVIGDNNHKAVPEIFGICVMSADNKVVYINGQNTDAINGFIEYINNEKPEVQGHEIKNDYYMLMHYGLKECNTYFDTAVGQYVLDSSRSNYELKTLAYEYFHENIQSEKELMEQTGQLDMFTDPIEIYKDYGIKWCAAVSSLTPVMKEKIKDTKLDTVAYEVEMPLIEVMASMEYEGVSVDETELVSLGSVIKERIDEMTSQIHNLAGEEFNINSPKQLGVILFEKMGLTAGKKTKSGYSTSADILEKIADEHPIVPLILEYRTLTKLDSTYIEGLLPLITKEKKIHAHFNQTVTATGRISCTEPNLQNIPIRQEFGRQIRRAFVPSDNGNVLVGADYSQIELRVLAHMAEDQVLIDAFNNGEDIHRSTAANVLGVKPEDITVEERSRAKAVNFGVIYGMSSFGLSSELKITRRDADNYIKTYFDKHTAVKSFMDGQVELCKENGFVTTMLGRKRYINEITASNFMTRQMGERLAMNSPIQGSAADIIKIAMIKVYNALKESGLKSKLILQVHDELIIDTYKDEQMEVERLLVENMEAAVEMKTKLIADLNNGSNWYELK